MSVWVREMEDDRKRLGVFFLNYSVFCNRNANASKRLEGFRRVCVSVCVFVAGVGRERGRGMFSFVVFLQLKGGWRGFRCVSKGLKGFMVLVCVCVCE